MLKQTLIKTLVICAMVIMAISQTAYAQNSEFKITPDDGTAGDNFGISASISGDYAIVGARFDDDNGDESGNAIVNNSNDLEYLDIQPEKTEKTLEERQVIAIEGIKNIQRKIMYITTVSVVINIVLILSIGGK